MHGDLQLVHDLHVKHFCHHPSPVGLQNGFEFVQSIKIYNKIKHVLERTIVLK